MPPILGYRCSVCQREYGLVDVDYTCPDDGGNLDIVLDFERIRSETSAEAIAGAAERSIWRYLPLLPVDDPGHVGTPLRTVGCTPLLSPPRLAQRIGLQNLLLKDDGRNPTASLKDRASAVVVARAQEIGASEVVTASTGNAGAALAGMAAAVGMPAAILAPKTAPIAKVAQLLIYGARVILVDGTYDQAFDLSIEAIDAFGWYCRNTGYNPFTAEGKKTAAFEICEQLTRVTGGPPGRWAVPDAVLVSVGDGNIISGIHKGFKDLLEIGWIDRLPKLFGVQSEGSAAVYNAFKAGEETIEPVQANTLADSISVDLPRDGLRALRAATQTGGAYISVTDEAILDAVSELANTAAVFAEPAGAASYAGLISAMDQRLIHKSDQVVVMITGNGLKDISAAQRITGEPVIIEPNLNALKKLVGSDVLTQKERGSNEG